MLQIFSLFLFSFACKYLFARMSAIIPSATRNHIDYRHDVGDIRTAVAVHVARCLVRLVAGDAVDHRYDI